MSKTCLLSRMKEMKELLSELNTDTVEYINDKIVSFCKKYQVEYISGNGTWICEKHLDSERGIEKFRLQGFFYTYESRLDLDNQIEDFLDSTDYTNQSRLSIRSMIEDFTSIFHEAKELEENEVGIDYILESCEYSI